MLTAQRIADQVLLSHTHRTKGTGKLPVQMLTIDFESQLMHVDRFGSGTGLRLQISAFTVTRNAAFKLKKEAGRLFYRCVALRWHFVELIMFVFNIEPVRLGSYKDVTFGFYTGWIIK